MGGVAQILKYPKLSLSLIDVGLFVRTMLNNLPSNKESVSFGFLVVTGKEETSPTGNVPCPTGQWHGPGVYP